MQIAHCRENRKLLDAICTQEAYKDQSWASPKCNLNVNLEFYFIYVFSWSNPGPWQWKRGALNTGLPGNSLKSFDFISLIWIFSVDSLFLQETFAEWLWCTRRIFGSWVFWAEARSRASEATVWHIWTARKAGCPEQCELDKDWGRDRVKGVTKG